MPVDLDALEALLAVSSPAPWTASASGGPHKGEVRDEGEVVAVTYCGTCEGHGARHADLIAALRNAADDLIAEAREGRRLREEVEGVRALCVRLASTARAYMNVADLLTAALERPKEEK